MNEGLKVEITNKDTSYGSSRIYYYSTKDEGNIFRIEQIPFPNCCGIAILKNLSMSTSSVDANLFCKIIGEIVEDLKNNDKFSKLMFYTNSGNYGFEEFQKYPEVSIIPPFRNRRSGHTLMGFEIDLTEPEKVSSKPVFNDDPWTWEIVTPTTSTGTFNPTVRGTPHSQIEPSDDNESIF